MTERASDFPLPEYAAYVWYDGQSVKLGLPAALGEHGHTVSLPLNERSWAALLEILNARRQSERTGRQARRIGNASAPVQYDLDELMRRLGRASPRSGVPQPGGTSLRDLGLED